MDSKNFMKWVDEKLVPTFEIIFPRKKLVMFLDNAEYHHKRGIPSLASMSKVKVCELMIKHGVTHLDLPLTEKRQVSLTPANNDLIFGGKLRFPFNPKVFVSRLSKSNLLCFLSSDEFNLAFVEWLQENKPSFLECAVEKLLNSKGHRVLWTPTYAPDLQPIELFWAGVKNFVALH
mmetsp:Transcript_22636/g.66987  ORF Transcript_22636/g.66987 Transcript_22636/m.66987 type:complete len:176 (-) Transcript_22636:527-1054(-)